MVELEGLFEAYYDCRKDKRDSINSLSFEVGYEEGLVDLCNEINSQILAFAFGLSAQIERDLISQRTKEGLARRRANGMQLGRKKGDKNTHYKLTGKEGVIRTMLDYGYSKAAICRKLKCNFKTLDDHLERMQEKSCELEDN